MSCNPDNSIPSRSTAVSIDFFLFTSVFFVWFIKTKRSFIILVKRILK